MPDTATIALPAPSTAALPTAGGVAAGLLAEITADLSTGADIRALLGHFLEPIVQLAHARAGAVRMLCDDDRLRLVSQLGLPAQLGCAGPSVHRHCGGCGQAVDSDRLAWDTGLSGCDGAARDVLVPLGWAHMLAVPLDHRGQVLGVYNLFFDAATGPSAEVRAVLRSIGTLLGLALHNARLEAENLRATVLQERQRMAAEVHDAVAQDLAFLRMRLPLLEQAIGEHNGALTTRYLVDLKQALGHAHGSLREIITDFRTPPDPRGLAHALAERADEFSRRSGIAVALTNDLPALALPAAHEAQVLHIVGEALSNIARHARARQAWLRLSAEAGQVTLRIEDDGIGLGPLPAEPGHHGLEIMAGRARRLGGALAVRPREGGGTVVAVGFPAPGAP
ncbi:ATP-binding protein [Ideonella sp. A 288]|uniref:GAF domain-containing sensor histidine kinase n=1 Tax=Ideonella sp. A 288 TaxID=1962181 RepID=UPI00130337A3|nr:ATP-binding protein [Ideonella sp. A 288]